jgi:hypothetical protein
LFYHNGIGDYGGTALPPSAAKSNTKVEFGFDYEYFAKMRDSTDIHTDGRIHEITVYSNHYSQTGKIFYRNVDVASHLTELSDQINKAYSGGKIPEFNAANAFVITWYLVTKSFNFRAG